MSDPLPDFDLDRYVPYRFAVIAERLSSSLAKQYKARFGISVAEWRVLVNLAYSGGVSVRDIQWRVSLEKSKVSRAVSRLETKGYVTKDTDTGDRRLLKLALTESGRALVSELVPLAEAFQAEIEQQLGPRFDALQEALDALMPEAE